jgi:RNA recognition motif-containing protein
MKFVDNTKTPTNYAFVKFEDPRSVENMLGKSNFEIELVGPSGDKITCMKTVSRSALMDRQIKISQQKKAEKKTKNLNP